VIPRGSHRLIYAAAPQTASPTLVNFCCSASGAPAVPQYRTVTALRAAYTRLDFRFSFMR
jgi:hypothetical protein